MNNKGLTLVELLAIIVVISILLVVAVPQIGNLIEDSRKNTFLGEAQGVFRAAEIKAFDLANTGNGGIINSKSSTKLDMSDDNLDYCVIVDEDANITSITVSNGKYIVSGDSSFMSQDATSVTEGNMNSFTCE